MNRHRLISAMVGNRLVRETDDRFAGALPAALAEQRAPAWRADATHGKTRIPRTQFSDE